MQKTPSRPSRQRAVDGVVSCRWRRLPAKLLLLTVPRQPEVLSGHSGLSLQLTAASGQRRTSVEALVSR